MVKGYTYKDVIESNKQVMDKLDASEKLIIQHKEEEKVETKQFFFSGIIIGALFSFIGASVVSCLYYLKSTYGGGNNLFWDIITFISIVAVFVFMLFLFSLMINKSKDK